MNIEFFPCSGGMAEGFRRAGVVFDLAFDKDPHACASYEGNHGHRPIQMDVHDLLRLADGGGWRPREGIDLLVADPPCTPWSRAGKREGLADSRDCLRATAELIALLRPRAYLVGNVPGLQDSTSWHVVQDVIGGLAKHGYCVADYVSLDAADYGVPQHRVRPFWFGHLDGPCVRWPAPTHGAPSEQLAIGGVALRPWVTCREALGHLSLEDLGRPVRMRIREAGEKAAKDGGDASRCSAADKPASTVVAAPGRKGGQILIPNDGHPPARHDEPAPTIRGGGSGHSAPQVVLFNDRHAPNEADAPAKTLGAKTRGQGGQGLRTWDNHPPSTPDAPAFGIKTNGGRKGTGGGATLAFAGLERSADSKHGSSFSKPNEPAATLTRNTHSEGATLEWPWDRPATNVAASDDRLPSPGHHASGSGHSTQHGPNAVILSERAAAILQGFPENWCFSGDTKKARWSQIGQAMPPGLAEPVARAIVEQMRAARGERAIEILQRPARGATRT